MSHVGEIFIGIGGGLTTNPRDPMLLQDVIKIQIVLISVRDPLWYKLHTAILIVQSVQCVHCSYPESKLVQKCSTFSTKEKQIPSKFP